MNNYIYNITILFRARRARGTIQFKHLKDGFESN